VEGTIANIEELDAETAWRRYEQLIFLTREEYDSYVTKPPITRENREAGYITLFTLENLKESRTPTKTIKPITPTVCYITKEEYIKMNR
jgi:hypothetical protein